jgi:hypothetical protein
MVKKVKEDFKKNKIYSHTSTIDGEFHQFFFPAICAFLLVRSFGLQILVKITGLEIVYL